MGDLSRRIRFAFWSRAYDVTDGVCVLVDALMRRFYDRVVLRCVDGMSDATDWGESADERAARRMEDSREDEIPW